MIQNTGTEAILAGFTAAAIAQWLKFFFYLRRHQKINFRILTDTGGMPSSHSSAVIALTTSIGLINGFSSSLFAVSLGYALIVMYDAAGLRRSAGKMAATLNKIMDDFYAHKADPYEKIKELLGHTPVEVLMGALLGIVISLAFHYCIL